MCGDDLSTTQSLRTQEGRLVPGSMWPEVSYSLGPYPVAQWLRSRELLVSFGAKVMGVN